MEIIVRKSWQHCTAIIARPHKRLLQKLRPECRRPETRRTIRAAIRNRRPTPARTRQRVLRIHVGEARREATTAAIAEVSRSSGRRTVVGVRLGDGRAQQAAAALAHGKRRE